MIKAIWIRVPKCAGTSIDDVLKRDGLLADSIASSNPILKIETGKARAFRHQHPDFWSSRLRFAVIRNPWDRVVSGWRYVSNKPLKTVLKNMPKPENFHAWHHLARPQADFILDDSGRLLPNYLIRFENLESELDILWQKLQLPALSLYHHNQGTRETDYRLYFDAETRDWVARVFEQDIETLGYKF